MQRACLSCEAPLSDRPSLNTRPIGKQRGNVMPDGQARRSPMRVTNRADKALGDVVPGVRRAIFFDAPEGAAQLSLGAAEIDPGKRSRSIGIALGRGMSKRASLSSTAMARSASAIR